LNSEGRRYSEQLNFLLSSGQSGVDRRAGHFPMVRATQSGYWPNKSVLTIAAVKPDDFDLLNAPCFVDLLLTRFGGMKIPHKIALAGH
jgi:hypothetical protein